MVGYLLKILLILLLMQGELICQGAALNLQSEGKLKCIEAKDVDYDGNLVRLSGSVHINHQVGELFCDRAVLLLPQADKASHKAQKGNQKLSPERILMSGQVKMILGDGSTILSDEADIDCRAAAAMFVATKAKKVVYISPKNEKEPPMKATSRTMYIVLEKTGDGANSRYAIADLKASDSVQIEYLDAHEEKQEKHG